MAEVGKSTGKKTQAGREVYETPDGEMVSEKSTTFKYKGKWINIPTIHNGYAYDDDILRMMLDAEVIEPTSIHKSKEDAIKSAIERSKSLKFDEGGLASQTEEAFKTKSDRLMAQSDERKLGSGLTSLEFEADMMPLLKKDPIAMLGYKASMPNRRFPSIQKLTGNNTPLYYDVSKDPIGPNYNPSSDKVGYGRDYGSSKDVILHELRHRGLKILEERYKEKDSFIADYGDMAHRLLDKADISGTKSNEFVVELYDNPDATYIKPGDSGSKNTIGYVADTLQFVDPNSDTQVMPDVADELLGIALSSEDHSDYRSLVDRNALSKEEIETGKTGLNRAAIDLLNEIDVLGFDKGGLATQTEEALGWTAEGKKLAVDIPEVSFKDAATFVAEMTPIVGDALAAKEVYDELQKDEPNYYLAGALGGAALVGLVPGLGDAAAKAIKKGAREVFDAGKRLTSKTPSKSKPSYTDTELLEADDIIDEWGKGNLTNTELRNQMRDKGFTIETKRISPKKTGDDLEVVGPDGNIIPWKDMPRGVVKKSSDKDLLDGISKYFKRKSAPRFEESAIATAANQNDLSREILVEMPINDFLAAAKKEVSPEKLENTRRLISEGTPFETVPSLQFKNNGDGTAKVIGHDGRHRAMALKEQGETTIPVRLQSSGGDGPSIRWGQQNNPSSSDYVDTLPKQLVEEDGEALINMPDTGIRRKEDLGFNEDVYHYTVSKTIEGDKFNPDRATGPWNKLGVHVGGQKASNDRFTGINDPERYPENVKGSTLPLKARTDKPLMFSDEVESEYSVQSNLRKMAEARGLDPTDYAADLRKQLAEEGYTHIPYINEVEAEGTISYIMLVDRPEGSDAVLRSKFAEFDPSKKDKPELGLAQGGAVDNMSMKKQMSLFEYGGIADDGMNKDPVSGNNVPPGSLAKEVRDDIPAMLSEGEYVVPADVLRYYGVNFFENLRGQAKQGLNTMEQNGRIGGTPMTQQDVARNMQQPMAPAPVQAAQGAMMQSPMRVQQQPAPQAIGNSGIPTQGYAGEDGSIVSRWSPARARYSSPMFQGTSSQQANIQSAQEQAATESITYMRTHYNQNGESIQVAYEGTDPASATPKAGQDQLLSDYPLTEEEWIAYKSEMSQNTGDDGGSGGGGDTTVSGGSDTSWMEGIDFTDKASVQKWVDSKEGLGMSAEATALAKRGGILGAVPQAIQAQDIAKVRGLAAVYAESDPEFAKELLASAQKSVDASGSLVISAFEKLGLLSGADAAKQLNSNITDLALTKDSVDAYGNPIFKDDDDWFTQLQAVAQAGMTYDPNLKSTVTDPNTGEETVVTGGYSSDDGDPFAWMEDIGGVQQVETGDDVNVVDITDSEEFEATGGIRPKSRPDTGANTGGLMTTPKPKKKSKPKKTGLAGKK